MIMRNIRQTMLPEVAGFRCPALNKAAKGLLRVTT